MRAVPGFLIIHLKIYRMGCKESLLQCTVRVELGIKIRLRENTGRENFLTAWFSYQINYNYSNILSIFSSSLRTKRRSISPKKDTW